MMLEEWQPVPDKKPSQCLYGLGPDTVKEPGNPHLAAVLFFLLTHVEATGFESSYQENSRRERRMYAFADSLLIMYIITLHCQGLRFAPLCKRVRRSIVHRLTALFRLKSYLSASILEWWFPDDGICKCKWGFQCILFGSDRWLRSQAPWFSEKCHTTAVAERERLNSYHLEITIDILHINPNQSLAVTRSTWNFHPLSVMCLLDLPIEIFKCWDLQSSPA